MPQISFGSWYLWCASFSARGSAFGCIRREHKLNETLDSNSVIYVFNYLIALFMGIELLQLSSVRVKKLNVEFQPLFHIKPTSLFCLLCTIENLTDQCWENIKKPYSIAINNNYCKKETRRIQVRNRDAPPTQTLATSPQQDIMCNNNRSNRDSRLTCILLWNCVSYYW